MNKNPFASCCSRGHVQTTAFVISSRPAAVLPVPLVFANIVFLPPSCRKSANKSDFAHGSSPNARLPQLDVWAYSPDGGATLTT